MPELPDVEVFKRYLDATALHQTVEEVTVEDPDLLEGVSGDALRRRLRGRELAGTRRHGKYLFAEAAGEGWLVLHFGMTGFLKYFRREDSAPDHPRLLLAFFDGYRLAYDCQRKFGAVGWTGDVDRFVADKGLGPDPLGADFGLAAFRARLDGRRGAIKPTLMNQEVLAGVGNVYSDEILFHAGIHPERKVPDLGEDDVAAIHRALGRVLEEAIRAQVDPHRLPDGYLLPRREEGAGCPRCAGTVRRKKVSGRSAYFCGDHQR